MPDPEPYADLSLEELLERIRTHRWWKGERRTLGILAHYRDGKFYTAAVWRDSGYSRSSMTKEVEFSNDSACQAARDLLVHLDVLLHDRVASLRKSRDGDLRAVNALIEQLTGVPESTALADATGAP